MASPRKRPSTPAVTSTRPVDAAPGSGGDAGIADEVLMRAVREEVLAYGIRRATVTSIAKRAGVARVTVYRRGGGSDRLVLDCLSAEFAEIATRAAADGAAAASGRERLVATIGRAIDRLRQSELVAAVLRHDPELLLTYVVDRLGQSQRTMLALLERLLAEGVADGSIRADVDPRAGALTLLLAVQSFVVSAEILRSEGALGAVDEQIRALLDGYLRPRR